MQVVIPRWKNISILKSSIALQPSATHYSSRWAQFTWFHCTPIYSEKWKNKWKSAFRQPKHPSKNYIRYTRRQKRADAKRALKDILFKGGSSKIIVQNGKQEDHSNSSDWKSNSKSSADHASKARYRKMRCKIKPEGYADDFDAHFETVFQATFGNRWSTWSFRNWKEPYFQYFNDEFEWRKPSNRRNNESREPKNASDFDYNDETCAIDSSAERKILGLPLKGHLKIEDVKKAFHLSALKWHPDKHQSSSQAMAEEKFKHCVNAYKSLCNALS